MKIALLNSNDLHGGAAIATYRIFKALRSVGIEASLIVQRKESSDQAVIEVTSKTIRYLRSAIDNLFLFAYKSRKKIIFTSAIVPESISKVLEKINPQIIHIFWIADGFLKIENLRKFKTPIVWTLHDMWPMTGGCHYAGDCRGYLKACGNCPALNSHSKNDLSKWNLTRKCKIFQDLDLTIVVGNKWLEKCVKESAALKHCRVEVIQNCLDLKKYKPLDKESSRIALGLPTNKKLILFSAHDAMNDPRKGGHLLCEALEQASQNGLNNEVELVILGCNEEKKPSIPGMHIRCLGNLRDEISQILLYSASDFLIAPSMQENLSNTVIEAMACGLPAIAFDVGGMADIITDQLNGYITPAFDIKMLSEAIWSMLNKDRKEILEMRKSARKSIEEKNDFQLVAGQYEALYEELIKNSTTRYSA